MQAWFSRRFPGRSPYRLYSLSNLGSLLALLTYPFLIEPMMKPRREALVLASRVRCVRGAMWLSGDSFSLTVDERRNHLSPSPLTGEGRGEGGGLAGTATPHPGSLSSPKSGPSPARGEGRTKECPLPQGARGANFPTPLPRGARGSRSLAAASDQACDPITRPTVLRCLLWLFLPSFASLMLLATTNHACQDVAVIPFLFIVPLSLYLLTFIICFDHARWYVPRLFATATLLIVLAAVLYAFQWHNAEPKDKYDSILLDVGLSFAGMFTVCMMCHGELVRLKPHPRYLTMFYLFIAAGGSAGWAVRQLLIAPLIFRSYAEWGIGWLGGALLAASIILGTEERGIFRRYPWIFGPAFLL